MAHRPWLLIVGFTLSAIGQALVKKATITRLLGDRRPRVLAELLGAEAASGGCAHVID